MLILGIILAILGLLVSLETIRPAIETKDGTGPIIGFVLVVIGLFIVQLPRFELWLWEIVDIFRKGK